MSNNAESKREPLKAGAVICPKCCIEYTEVEFDLELDGVILHNVKALQCPVCQEELFTPEQSKDIQKRLHSTAPP